MVMLTLFVHQLVRSLPCCRRRYRLLLAGTPFVRAGIVRPPGGQCVTGESRQKTASPNALAGANSPAQNSPHTHPFGHGQLASVAIAAAANRLRPMLWLPRAAQRPLEGPLGWPFFSGAADSLEPLACQASAFGKRSTGTLMRARRLRFKYD